LNPLLHHAWRGFLWEWFVGLIADNKAREERSPGQQVLAWAGWNFRNQIRRYLQHPKPTNTAKSSAPVEFMHLHDPWNEACCSGNAHEAFSGP